MGAQLIARVLGAEVFPGGKPELGWYPLELTDAGLNSPLKHLAPEHTQVLHWHAGVFDLPSGAIRLASTEACENQTFMLGGNLLGLQFHAEASSATVEQWLMGHAHQIEANDGLSYQKLRDDFRYWGPILQPQAEKCLHEWLEAI